MDSSHSKPKLSRAILDMKFMKKTKERVEKEQEDAEGHAMYSNDISDQMRKGGKYTFVEVSINFCRDLIEGHLSFGGMNPEIERIMEKQNAKRVQKNEKDKETEISDFEMAKRYNPLAQKSQDKKKNNHKRSFLKPAEIDY